MKLPIIINQEEFEKLFDYAIKEKKKNSKQYALAMLLGFEAGLRISEILGWEDKVPSLTPDRIEDASIRVISGKGGKDRIVPRPKRLNETAKKMFPLTIKRRALQSYFKLLSKKVLNKDLHFHSLRHGFCSHLAGKGRPLHEIQMLAGHSRLDTTGIYLHANPKLAIEGARDVF